MRTGNRHGSIRFVVIDLFFLFIASANDQYCSYRSLGEATNTVPVLPGTVICYCQSIQTPFLPLDRSGVHLPLVRSCRRDTSPGGLYPGLADHSVVTFLMNSAVFRIAVLIISCCAGCCITRTGAFCTSNTPKRGHFSFYLTVG